MRRNPILRFGLYAGLSIVCYGSAISQDEVPCLIFTGNSDTAECIDLSKHNRITFEEDAMIVSSSTDPTGADVRLLYTEYNHLEIGDAVPTGSTGVDYIKSNDNIQLAYQPDSKSLTLKSSPDITYSIGVFSLKGTLIATSEMRGGQSLSLGSLTAGTYIVLATNGESKTSIKIIIK